MPFTEYLYDAQAITERAAQARANLKANRGLSNALAFQVGNVKSRLEKSRFDYLTYGPYWWAVKEILQKGGVDYGKETHEFVKATYRAADDFETLIMAETFRDQYRATQFVGTRQFMLDGESGEFYTLFDDDMEVIG